MSAGDPHRVPVHVVAGAVTDARGRVLIAQRPPGKHLAGGWEFPGGKREPGEERAHALARELREELGIIIREPRPLIRVWHTYPTREILLDLWVVKRYRGEPRGLDGQPLRWCNRRELAAADLLPADKPLVRTLRLPERLTRASAPDYRVDTRARAPAPAAGFDRQPESRLDGVLCASVAEAQAFAGAGTQFLVMRDELGADELAALCRSVPMPVFARGIALERAWALGASGVNEIGETHARHGKT